MSFVQGLKCRECGREYEKTLRAGCEDCFAPLEIAYDYPAIARHLSRELIQSREKNLWRYRELLPLDGEPCIGRSSGATPLVRAERLGRILGLRNLYLKNDSVNAPTLSFKDRVTAVAVNKAIEFGLEAVGCASTGNLANSVAANAAAAGLPAYILIPDNLEPSKVNATSDVWRAGDCRARQLRRREPAMREIADRFHGDLSTSTCARFMAKARRRSVTKLPSNLAGERPIVSSCRWPAAR